MPRDRARSRKRPSSAGVKCAPFLTTRARAGSLRGRPRRVTPGSGWRRPAGSCKFATRARRYRLRAQASRGQPLPAREEPACCESGGEVSRAGKHGWLLTGSGSGLEAPGAVELKNRQRRWGDTTPVAPSRAEGWPDSRSRQGFAGAGLSTALDPTAFAGPSKTCGRGGRMGSGSRWVSPSGPTGTGCFDQTVERTPRPPGEPGAQHNPWR